MTQGYKTQFSIRYDAKYCFHILLTIKCLKNSSGLLFHVKVQNNRAFQVTI